MDCPSYNNSCSQISAFYIEISDWFVPKNQTKNEKKAKTNAERGGDGSWQSFMMLHLKIPIRPGDHLISFSPESVSKKPTFPKCDRQADSIWIDPNWTQRSPWHLSLSRNRIDTAWGGFPYLILGPSWAGSSGLWFSLSFFQHSKPAHSISDPSIYRLRCRLRLRSVPLGSARLGSNAPFGGKVAEASSITFKWIIQTSRQEGCLCPKERKPHALRC